MFAQKRSKLLLFVHRKCMTKTGFWLHSHYIYIYIYLEIPQPKQTQTNGCVRPGIVHMHTNKFSLCGELKSLPVLHASADGPRTTNVKSYGISLVHLTITHTHTCTLYTMPLYTLSRTCMNFRFCSLVEARRGSGFSRRGQFHFHIRPTAAVKPTKPRMKSCQRIFKW